MSTPTKRSAKGRKMYQSPSGTIYRLKESPWIHPVFVLPASPDDVERMRETVAKAFYENGGPVSPAYCKLEPRMRTGYERLAEIAITALGIITPTKKT